MPASLHPPGGEVEGDSGKPTSGGAVLPPGERRPFCSSLNANFYPIPLPVPTALPAPCYFFLHRCYQGIMFISCKGAVTAAVELTIYGQLDRCWQSVGEHGHCVVGAPGLRASSGTSRHTAGSTQTVCDTGDKCGGLISFQIPLAPPLHLGLPPLPHPSLLPAPSEPLSF